MDRAGFWYAGFRQHIYVVFLFVRKFRYCNSVPNSRLQNFATSIGRRNFVGKKAGVRAINWRPSSVELSDDVYSTARGARDNALRGSICNPWYLLSLLGGSIWSGQISTDHFVGPGKACVSVCVRAITLELFTVDLVCWSILTLYKSGVKVKVTSHFSHKQVLNYPEHVLYHFRNARLFWLQPRRAIHISNNCYLNLVENDVF